MSENLKKAGDKAGTGHVTPGVAGTPDKLIDELRDRVAFLERELRARPAGPGAGEETRACPSHGLGHGGQALPPGHLSPVEKYRYLDSFFDITITPLVLLDRDFNFIRVNKAYARACQKDPDEFPGHNHFEYYPSDARAIFEDVVRTRQPVQVAARPFVFPDHPGLGVTYWNWTLTPLLDERGDVEALFFSLEDVTALKRAEIELERHRDRLQAMVGEQTRDLETANELLRNEITERKRAEDGLRENERRFRAIFDQAAVGMGQVSLDGRFMRVNRKFCDNIGYTYHELMGLGPGDITHPDDIPEEQRQIDRLLAGEASTFTSEKRYVRKDGTIVWINLTVTLVYIDGKPAYFSGVTEDITGRKRAEEALRESEASLARAQAIAHLASWEVDVRTNLVLGSEELYRMFNLKPDISMDAYIAKFHPDDRATVLESINAAIYQGKRYSTDYRIVPRPGDIRHVHADGEVVYDESGLPVKFFGTVQDITERKRTEEELKVARQQAELYLDLMGHDINNMHQIALGYLELAQNLPPGPLKDEMIGKPIEVLQRSARLIKNVRKLQNFSDGVFQNQDVDVCEVLSQVRREFGAVPGKAVTLNLNGNERCRVRANELLNDVFANLVGNAIKHTGDRADIVVSLDMTEKGRYCRVSVEDDGPGIPDGLKEKIFNRMLKSTSKAKGMGLGLYLVKSLVDSYGGKVWVEDRVPGDYTKGAKFVVLLPVNDQQYPHNDFNVKH
ncbi:MAG: putative diguanylate cyclase [Methanocella sp. PtaU1.Bin125]|nr:MAG: putative diguanylate cyclase [Methanocella sp. PtaU1.Bin125]